MNKEISDYDVLSVYNATYYNANEGPTKNSRYINKTSVRNCLH